MEMVSIIIVYMLTTSKKCLLALASLTICLVHSTLLGNAETLRIGTQQSATLVPAEAVRCPQPEITHEMLEQGIKAHCLAKFAIEPSGKHTVELLSSTGSPEFDELTLDTLRSWQFRPAQLAGDPVYSVRKIKVEFEVE